MATGGASGDRSLECVSIAAADEAQTRTHTRLEPTRRRARLVSFRVDPGAIYDLGGGRSVVLVGRSGGRKVRRSAQVVRPVARLDPAKTWTKAALCLLLHAGRDQIGNE